MKTLRLPLLLGLAHAVSDGSAGWLLGFYAAQDWRHAAELFLIYNALAFGAQPIVGYAVDLLSISRKSVVGAMILMAGALWIANISLYAAATCAGLASALFHVSGGALAIAMPDKKQTGAGLFAAPGVIGLAIGGLLAIQGFNAIVYLTLLLLTAATILFFEKAPEAAADSKRDEPILERHDLVMILLLAAIAFRSLVWTTFQAILSGESDLLIQMAIAAASGKLLGGFLSDKISWRYIGMGSLILSAPLLLFGQEFRLAFLTGILCLQASTPIILTAMGRLMPKYPATASGLVLGLGIAAGGMPGAFEVSMREMWWFPALTLVSAVCLGIGILMRNKTTNAGIPS